MATVDLLLFSKQGSLDLMLFDDHSDLDFLSHTRQIRPQTIAPLPWKYVYFVLRDAMTGWPYTGGVAPQ